MYCISDFCHLCLKDDKYLIDLSQRLPENAVIATKLGVCVSEVVSLRLLFSPHFNSTINNWHIYVYISEMVNVQTPTNLQSMPAKPRIGVQLQADLHKIGWRPKKVHQTPARQKKIRWSKEIG